MRTIATTVAVFLLGLQCATAETVLFDSEGFENNPPYPLAAVTNGQDGWTFVGAPSVQIEDLGAATKVMHVDNTTSHTALSRFFDGQTAGSLVIRFDVKASTVGSRTLILEVGNNVVAGNTSSGLATYLGWGVSSGMIRYLHPTLSWQDLIGTDTDWHHVDLVLDLNGHTYDVNLDGGAIELNDAPWWSTALDPTVTPINQVMLMAWSNGAANSDFMIDNLVISQVPEPSTAVLLAGLLGTMGLAWRRRRNRAGGAPRRGAADLARRA